MIYRLVKKERHKICRIDILVIVNNTVPCGYIKIFKWCESEHICCNKLLMIHPSVIGSIAVRNPVRIVTIDYHRVHPSMKIIEIKPFYRGDMQSELDKCGVVSTKYICPVIVISPLQVIFYQACLTPFP